MNLKKEKVWLINKKSKIYNKNYNISEHCSKIINYFDIKKNDLACAETKASMKCRNSGNSLPCIRLPDRCGTHREYNLI